MITTRPLNLKTILIISSSSALLLLLTLRFTFSPSSPPPPLKEAQNYSTSQDPSSSSVLDCCNKIPPSLAHALVHYATTNITPQQTLPEISVSLTVLQRRSPCNFLVFGLGHDSLMWTSLNHGGRTVFLEEDRSWIQQIRRRQSPSLPLVESYHVTYDTNLTQADQLLRIGQQDEACKVVVPDPRLSNCPLALKGLPTQVYAVEWDVIMVDAPTGYHDGAPGRMGAIYTAGLMARGRGEGGETDVFVHDVDRVVEDKFSNSFLCRGYQREQRGRIRHFTIPSHRTPRPFCPSL